MQELIRRGDSEREFFLRPHRTILQNPKSGHRRVAASGCGIVVLVLRFSHALL